MSDLVLDTNIVSYEMKGHALAGRHRRHLAGRTLAISFMTVAELYEGASRAGWGSQKIAALQSMLRNYVVIPASPNVCVDWGRIRSERRSRPISVDDAWVAACARAYGCTLVTHNPADFEGISGLEIVSEP